MLRQINLDIISSRCNNVLLPSSCRQLQISTLPSLEQDSNFSKVFPKTPSLMHSCQDAKIANRKAKSINRWVVLLVPPILVHELYSLVHWISNKHRPRKNHLRQIARPLGHVGVDKGRLWWSCGFWRRRRLLDG